METNNKKLLENNSEVQKLALYLGDNAARRHHNKFYQNIETIARTLNMTKFKLTEFRSTTSGIPSKYVMHEFSNPNFSSTLETTFPELLYHFIANIWPKTISTEKADFNELIRVFEDSDCYIIADLVRDFIRIHDVNILNKNLRYENWRKVGKLSYDPASPLGKGVGTKVYKGKFENRRDVAVKKITCDSNDLSRYQNELDMLVKFGLDSHPNIVNYIATELIKDDDPIILIALELCDFSLDKWVQQEDNTESKFLKINKLNQNNVLKQITTGRNFLHTNRIIHRDIKPENVLLKVVAKDIYVKISDFGISKRLPDGRTRMTNYTASGTEGWMAPEILQLHLKGQTLVKMRTSSDIFSLGCVFYYVLTKGSHLFGDFLRRNTNILENRKTIEPNNLEKCYIGCIPLIQWMTSTHPKHRPSTSMILNHHIFWTSENTLRFLTAISDLLNASLPKDNPLEQQLRLDKCSQENNPVIHDWIIQMNPEIKTFLDSSKHRKYSGTSVPDLLRAIRNFYNHYWEYPKEIQTALGEPPNAFLNYWTTKFPLLVNYIWENFQVVKCLPSLEQYYRFQGAGELLVSDMNNLEKAIYAQFVLLKYL